MSGGFWAWLAGPGGTLAGMSVALVVGTALGWLAHAAPRRVSRRERRELADRAADRAARQFRRMRQPELQPAPGLAPLPGRAMAEAVRKTSTAAFLDPAGSPFAAAMTAAAATGWEAHCDQAERIANGGPIDTGEIRAITEDMDVFIAGLLAAHPVPYPDGGEQA